MKPSAKNPNRDYLATETLSQELHDYNDMNRDNPIAAVFEITHTDIVPVHHGGQRSYGNFVDDMIRNNPTITKIVLDLKPEL